MVALPPYMVGVVSMLGDDMAAVSLLVMVVAVVSLLRMLFVGISDIGDATKSSDYETCEE